jgi:cell division protein FtsW
MVTAASFVEQVGEAAEGRVRWRMSAAARGLVLVTACLLAFGLAVLYSASAIVAQQMGYGGAYFFLKQITGVAVGIVLFAVAAKVDAGQWERWAWPLMVLSLVLMTVVVVPWTTGIAPRVHGSRRWLLATSFQPSELAKLAVIAWTAMMTLKLRAKLRRFSKGPLPVLAVVALLAALAAKEPDYSAAMLYVLIMAIILYVGGARVGHFILLAAVAVPLMVVGIEKSAYASQRVRAWWTPDSVSKDVRHQVDQSLIAVGSGGVIGKGLGNGRQQLGFLPFGYNDFIGSIVGEEWGFVGMAALILAYAAFALLGFRIARNARTPFLRLVATGLTSTVVITAYLHLAVVLDFLPATGLTLPFISYGRTNLVLSLLMTGILVNIGSTREEVFGDGHRVSP